jgi:hypothetical protein
MENETTTPTAPSVELVEKKPKSYVYESSLQSRNLLLKAKNELPEEIYGITLTLANTIANDGLKIIEACRIARITMDQLKAYCLEYPIIQEIIDVKEAEFKHQMLQRVSIKARNGDDKAAQWLLEQRFPEEFALKKGKAPNGDDDMIAQAITFIQENGDSTPVVKKSATLLQVRRVGAQVKDNDVKKLKSFLN